MTNDESEMGVTAGLAEAHLDQAALVLTDAFAEYPVELSFTPASLRRMCEADDVILDACVVARAGDGRLLGVGLAALRQHRGRVAAMGVARDAQHRGIGRALGHAVLDALCRRGAREVVLEALTVNAPALALYEQHLHFTRQRRLVGFTRPPGGPPISQRQWAQAAARGEEPDSWQLARVVQGARAQADLTTVPAVIPEHHPIARMLEDAGLRHASIEQYELNRSMLGTVDGTPCR